MHSSLIDKVKLLNYSIAMPQKVHALMHSNRHRLFQLNVQHFPFVSNPMHVVHICIYVLVNMDFLIIRMIILMLIYKNRNVQYDLKHDVTLISSPSRMVGSFIVKAFVKCVVFNFTDSIQPYGLLSIFSLVANLLQYICTVFTLKVLIHLMFTSQSTCEFYCVYYQEDQTTS